MGIIDTSLFEERVSGILLHPTSLPSQYGIGDLGQQAYQFIDFLAEAKQQIWQILPLGPTGYGNSPYQCYSAVAGNPLLIGLDYLQEAGWLSDAEINTEKPNFPLDHVNFELVIPYKMGLLEKAYQNFLANATKAEKEDLDKFCLCEKDWLSDYAMFMALKEAYQGKCWTHWDVDIKNRKKDALATWQKTHKDRILYNQFLQYVFMEQWRSLKAYAKEKNILIFGDIPIYVAHDSADVWAEPENFQLDLETGEPTFMAGVPPDYFSQTGQLWGNPVFNWENLEKTGFQWWIDRIQRNLALLDIVRIDHFRGFEAFWSVPQGESTAENGTWVKAPGQAFFQALKSELGYLPIIAEDLGVITQEVEELRDNFSFPGMKILQFAFDSERKNIFLPYNYLKHRCVVYTGTHDNDTTVGWFYSRSEEENSRVIDYLGCIGHRGIHWSLIQLAMGSIAKMAIFPLQDILGLGSDARMNTPGQAEGNWTWRYRDNSLNQDLSGHLAYLTHLYGRDTET